MEPSPFDSPTPAEPEVETEHTAEFVAELRRVADRLPERVNIDAESVEQGLAKLVLTLIELIRRLLEKQAVRRMEGGGLSPEQVEELGLALMKLEEKMAELKEHFGLQDEEFNIDLGPIGKQILTPPGPLEKRPLSSERTSLITARPPGLVDVLDRILDKGLVIAGDIKVSLANVELLTLQIRLLVCSIDKAEQIEELGLALMKLEEKMAELKGHFGLQDEELNIDLGPVGKLL